MLPFNYTFSVSYHCNSRCKTCKIYKKKANELSLEEWSNVFTSLGSNPFWATISGGEPFLRKDLYQLVCILYDKCMPAIINIPTNGLLDQHIPKTVEQIAAYCKESQIVINVSIDDIKEKNDVIRGVKGSFTKAVETFSALKLIDAPNLSIGIHTVISRFNVSRIPEIYSYLRKYKPDSYITEIAEERKELDTIGANISPGYPDYVKAVDFLIQKLKEDDFKRIGRITRAFRIEYYKMVKKLLKIKKQVIPCYAGFASVQIAPDGDVWMCCIEADSIGNLRDADYKFKKVWFSEKAAILRRRIKDGKCHCPLANASYTNMLHDLKSLTNVGWNLIRKN